MIATRLSTQHTASGVTGTLPVITLILPFEPKMNAKPVIMQSLRSAADELETKLKGLYPHPTAARVIENISHVFSSLNFNTHKQSIAIIIGKKQNRIIYLDTPLKKRIVISQAFDICDLINARKQEPRFLLLAINTSQARIYQGMHQKFSQMVAMTTRMHSGTLTRQVHAVTGSRDPAVNNSQEKFLRRVEASLDLVQNAWHLPVFIAGPRSLIEGYKKFSRHLHWIIETIETSGEPSNTRHLATLLQPYLVNWKQLNRQRLEKMIDAAIRDNKLVTDPHELRMEVQHAKHKILFVNNDFRCASPKVKLENDHCLVTTSHVQHIDEIIEKALETGGDLEFMDLSRLPAGPSMALLRY